MLYSDELYHYGVQGMKWGKVRRRIDVPDTRHQKSSKQVKKESETGYSYDSFTKPKTDKIRRSTDTKTPKIAYTVDGKVLNEKKRTTTKEVPSRTDTSKNARPGNKNKLDAKTGKGVTPKKATSTGGVNATQIKRVNLDNYRRVDSSELRRVDPRANNNSTRNKPATPGVNASQKNSSKTSSKKKEERKNSKRVVKIKR